MLKIEWKESNLNSLYNKLNKIVNNLVEHIEKGVNEALNDSKEKALELKRGSKDKNLLLTELTKKGQEVIGRLYTNFSYAPFLEYGTGNKSDGTMPHIGKTNTFTESGMKYWYLPVEKADREFSPSRIITIHDKQFYIMYATQPYPFMRPTAFYMKKHNIEKVKEYIRKGINEDIK